MSGSVCWCMSPKLILRLARGVCGLVGQTGMLIGVLGLDFMMSEQSLVEFESFSFFKSFLNFKVEFACLFIDKILLLR
jgi:hypothetical protein